MNRRTKVIAAGATAGALTLGAAGIATAVANSGEENTGVVSSVAVEQEAAEAAPATFNPHKMQVTVPAGYGLFFLDQNGELQARNATIEDLGTLAEEVQTNLQDAAKQSYLIIDMSTLESQDGIDGISSILLTKTKTGDFPVGKNVRELRRWLNGVFDEADASPAVKFLNGTPPAAYVEYTREEDGVDWTIREYVLQFDRFAVNVHVATDANSDGQDVARDILRSLELV